MRLHRYPSRKPLGVRRIDVTGLEDATLFVTHNARNTFGLGTAKL